jgi:hypothetical protein
MGLHFSPTDYNVPGYWVSKYQYLHIIIRTGLKCRWGPFMGKRVHSCEVHNIAVVILYTLHNLSLPLRRRFSLSSHYCILMFCQHRLLDWFGQYICWLISSINLDNRYIFILQIVAKVMIKTLMCLVCGRILGTVANLIAPLLSSNNLQCILAG